MLYLGIFALEFLKTVVIFENKSLAHTMIFSTGSAFSKGLGCVFSEGSGPVLVYKICLLESSTIFHFSIKDKSVA